MFGMAAINANVRDKHSILSIRSEEAQNETQSKEFKEIGNGPGQRREGATIPPRTLESVSHCSAQLGAMLVENPAEYRLRTRGALQRWVSPHRVSSLLESEARSITTRWSAMLDR